MVRRVYHKLRRTISRHIARRPYRRLLDRAIVSFTFDDFPVDASTTGASILERQGVRGTYYTSFGLVEKTEPTGRIFSLNDLRKLRRQGHEIGCHTFSHLDAWYTPPSEFEKELEKNAHALQEHYPEESFATFSYPLNCPSPANKRVAGRRFAGCRAGGQRFNGAILDLNALSSFFLEKSRGDLASVCEVIDRNAVANGWLIFSTHDISDTPTRFGCIPEFLNAALIHAIESGADVLPVKDVLRLIGASR